MNQEKLDSLKKLAAEAVSRIRDDIELSELASRALPSFILPPDARESIKKNNQLKRETCSLIADLIHALEESNQPKQPTTRLAPDVAEFIFDLGENVIISVTNAGAKVIARADSATSETSYLLHYCTRDGRAVSEWFDSSMLSQPSGLTKYNQAEFTFALNQSVVINASSEEGRVISRAQYATSEDDYLLHYRAADGRAVTGWFGESMISPLHIKPCDGAINSAN